MRYSRVFISLAAFLLAAEALVGAPIRSDRTEKVTLNPDGTGKCELNLYVETPPQRGMGMIGSQDDLWARRVAMDIVRNSSGVDAWADVSWELAPDGRPHFKGTAYFKNLATFSLFRFNVLQATWARDATGGMALTVALPETRRLPPQPNDANLTDDLIKQQIAQARQSWENRKKQTEAGLLKLRVDSTYLLPGKTTQDAPLEAVAGGVRFLLEGKKMFEAADKFMNDDAAMTAALREGRHLWLAADNQMAASIIFGGKVSISAHTTGELKPQFDYAREVAAAKKMEMPMLNKAGLIDKDMPALDAPITPQPLD